MSSEQSPSAPQQGPAAAAASGSAEEDSTTPHRTPEASAPTPEWTGATEPELALVDFTAGIGADGTGDAERGALVVLGAGIGTSVTHLYGEFAAALVRELGPGTRVLGAELPGHGAGASATDFSVASLARAALTAVDAHAGATPFHYVGTSISGAVGQQLLAEHPERLASLTLIATTDYFPEPAGWRERAELVARAGTPTQVIGSAKLWFGPDFLAAHPERGTPLLHDLQNADRFSYAAACEALAHFDLRDTAGTPGVPVLALSGEHDVVTGPETVAALADKLGARHEPIADASHLLAVEQPERVAQLVAEHVRSARAATPAR